MYSNKLVLALLWLNLACYWKPGARFAQSRPELTLDWLLDGLRVSIHVDPQNQQRRTPSGFSIHKDDQSIHLKVSRRHQVYILKLGVDWSIRSMPKW